jgi:L-ascorbate metabolism protein UlaG (beta-lactamase superfamily)
MFPYQSARAALDLKAATVIPVHWGKFAESVHPWNEPVNLLLASADSSGLQVSIPYIGQPYSIGDKPLKTKWWNFP